MLAEECGGGAAGRDQGQFLGSCDHGSNVGCQSLGQLTLNKLQKGMLALASLGPARERCFTNQYLSQRAHRSSGRAGRAGKVI